MISYHAWVRRDALPDWLAMGWRALNSLEGTFHGQWAIHCVWSLPGEPERPTDAWPLFGTVESGE